LCFHFINIINIINRRKKQNQRMQQQVSFHDSVHMYVDTQHSMKDRQAMFYSRKEMREFREEILLNARLCKSMPKGESSCTMNATDYCVRGLEEYFNEDRMFKKRKKRVLAQLAVFLEQERQYLEEGLFTAEDSDTMAHRYRQITRHCEREARQGGLVYAKLEQRCCNPQESDSRCQASLMPRRRRVSLGPSAA
jgi:hypothetical protein